MSQTDGQILIAQETLRADGALAALTALCAIARDGRTAGFWLQPPDGYTQQEVAEMAKQRLSKHSGLIAEMAGAALVPGTPQQNSQATALEAMLAQPGIKPAFFYVMNRSVNTPSTVLHDPLPGVVSLDRRTLFSRQHSITFAPALDRLEGKKLNESSFLDILGASRPVVMVLASDSDGLAGVMDGAMKLGLLVATVALNDLRNVTVVASPDSLADLQRLAGELGPHMTLVTPPSGSEPADIEQAGEAPGKSAAAGTVLNEAGMTNTAWYSLAVGAFCMLVFFKPNIASMNRLLAQADGAAVKAASPVRAGSKSGPSRPGRKDGNSSLNTKPAAAAAKLESIGANPLSGSILSPQPLTTVPPRTLRDPKAIARDVRESLLVLNEQGKIKILQDEIGPRLMTSIEALDWGLRVDAAGIMLGLIDLAGGNIATLRRWFAALNVPQGFDDVRLAVSAASDVDKTDLDMRQALRLLESVQYSAKLAMAKVEYDEYRGTGRLGPANQRKPQRVSRASPERKTADTGLPDQVTTNVAAIYKWAKRMARETTAGYEWGEASADVGKRKITIPSVALMPHIHVEKDFIAFKKPDGQHWQLTEGRSTLLVRNVESALQSLDRNAGREAYNEPMRAFLSHLLSLAGQEPVQA